MAKSYLFTCARCGVEEDDHVGGLPCPGERWTATEAPDRAKSMQSMQSLHTNSPLLTPREVAILFRVNSKTVSRWATQGKLKTVRTLGGHRRFNRAEVEGLLAEQKGADGEG